MRGSETDAGHFSKPRSPVHFFSNEGDPREPLHIHAQSGNADAKFWLYPEVSVAYNKGFSARLLAECAAEVELRREEIERAWDEHFG